MNELCWRFFLCTSTAHALFFSHYKQIKRETTCEMETHHSHHSTNTMSFVFAFLRWTLVSPERRILCCIFASSFFCSIQIFILMWTRSLSLIVCALFTHHLLLLLLFLVSRSSYLLKIYCQASFYISAMEKRMLSI